jgi:Na+/H+ antiporter NhaD/arsenite permease-like protein
MDGLMWDYGLFVLIGGVVKAGLIKRMGRAAPLCAKAQAPQVKC